MDNNISFSKIVATPTLNSWSQAYNAGKLFAVLSLEKTQEMPQGAESLNMLGKDLLERLEQEFFAIEDKNLESIKKAISAIFEGQSEGIIISFAAGVFVNPASRGCGANNILYLFGLGNAKVFIKRDGNLGLALNAKDVSAKNIASSSGFLKENDLIVLTTDAFSQVVTSEDLDINLNNSDPTEITESLAPKIHKSENGKISAVVIKYKNPLTNPPDTQDGLDEALRAGETVDEEISEQGENVQEEGKTEKSFSPFNKYLSLLKTKLKDIKLKPTKKIFLAAAIIIVGILVFSVFLTIREQNNAKVRALFAQVYPEAQIKYSEGQSLLSLNKNLARDSFLAAQKILNDNMAKLPPKSKENIQAQDLLKKIDSGLAQFSPIDKSGLDRSKLSITVQNGSGIEGVAGKAAEILKELGYNVISTGNADNYDYPGVTIKVKKDQSKFTNLLKQDLAKDYTITASFSNLPADSPTSALIIIGK
jgi:hypothetical protein